MQLTMYPCIVPSITKSSKKCRLRQWWVQPAFNTINPHYPSPHQSYLLSWKAHFFHLYRSTGTIFGGSSPRRSTKLSHPLSIDHGFILRCRREAWVLLNRKRNVRLTLLCNWKYPLSKDNCQLLNDNHYTAHFLRAVFRLLASLRMEEQNLNHKR